MGTAAANPKITHVPELDRNARAQIEQTLKDAGVHADPSLGLSPALDNPVLSTQAAKELGAINVGNEQVNFQDELGVRNRDFKEILKRIFTKVIGGGIKLRSAPTSLYDKITRKRMLEESKVEKKIDPREVETIGGN